MSPLLVKAVHTFLNGKASSGWLHFGPLEVYIRKGWHAIDGKGVLCFDLANAIMNSRGGDYVQLVLALPSILRQHPEGPKVIFIENVMLPHLEELYTRLGYKRLPSDPAPCFYKVVL